MKTNKNVVNINLKGYAIALNENSKALLERYYNARMNLVEVIAISAKNKKVYDNSIDKLLSMKKLDAVQKEQLEKDLKAKAFESERVRAFKGLQNKIFKECYESIPESLTKAFANKVSNPKEFRKEINMFFSKFGIKNDDKLFNIINSFGISSSGTNARIDNIHVKVESKNKFSTFVFDVILQIALDNNAIDKIDIRYVKELSKEKINSLDVLLKEVKEVKKPKNLTEYKKEFKRLGLKAPKENTKGAYAVKYAKYIRSINSVLVD